MTTKQIIERLRNYKNGILDEYLSKSDIDAGIAINAAIERLQELEKERDEARKEAFELRDYSYKFDKVLPWEKNNK